MSYSFQQAARAFKEDRIRELGFDADGLRFLKLRSLSRSQYMKQLAADCGLDVAHVPARDLLEFLFNSDISDEDIERAIRSIYERERQQRREAEPQLVSELYRLQAFDWGGLHQNSLEKTIVDRYVKKIKRFDELCDSIDNRLYPSMKSYVLCSWYNHWTSIIIEDIFKDHEAVVPAVGLIKKVDFFVNNRPFDLKVTYLPEGYIKDVRKAEGLRPELTLLKQFCRRNAIYYSNNLPQARLLEDLWAKVADFPSEEARNLILQLRGKREEILNTSMDSSSELIRWLYENQGVRRFDASNRLFLILVDKSNFFESWKLKRARALIAQEVHDRLDEMADHPGKDITFLWEGDTYQATAEVIFVVSETPPTNACT